MKFYYVVYRDGKHMISPESKEEIEDVFTIDDLKEFYDVAMEDVHISFYFSSKFRNVDFAFAKLYWEDYKNKELCLSLKEDSPGFLNEWWNKVNMWIKRISSSRSVS